MPVAKKKIIWGAVIVIILAVTIILCYIYQDEKGVTKNSNTNKETVNTNSETIDPHSGMRDSQRIRDIKTIQIALTSFYAENSSHYPTTLQELLDGEYLDWLPINSQPGGKSYFYSPIGGSPYKSYSLCYSLEIGSSGIGAGDHCATPAGVAVY